MPPSLRSINVEFSRETLDTMLDGLGKIRDQLSSVAKAAATWNTPSPSLYYMNWLCVCGICTVFIIIKNCILYGYTIGAVINAELTL